MSSEILKLYKLIDKMSTQINQNRIKLCWTIIQMNNTCLE